MPGFGGSRHVRRKRMLCWKCPRTRLGATSALTLSLLCWLYVYTAYRGPDHKEMLREVMLSRRRPWRRNETAAAGFRKLLDDCCDPSHLFSMSKVNTPVGENLWFDGELLYWLTIDNATYNLFPQEIPFKLPLKKCSVVGNGGILKGSRCGKQIDEADFVIRCNLPPMTSDFRADVGTKTQLVTANPSIIDKRFQNLLWSRKAFVESLKVYKSSYVYMPAFSMKHGTDPSIRVYHTLADFGTNQSVLFANPNFLRSVGKFWKYKGVHSRRLSTGLFMVSAALGLCQEVTVYGFWPFQIDLKEKPISHHYYDDVPPHRGIHSMPEEFLQLWLLHKSGILKVQLETCDTASSNQKPH